MRSIFYAISKIIGALGVKCGAGIKPIKSQFFSSNFVQFSGTHSYFSEKMPFVKLCFFSLREPLYKNGLNKNKNNLLRKVELRRTVISQALK